MFECQEYIHKLKIIYQYVPQNAAGDRTAVATVAEIFLYCKTKAYKSVSTCHKIKAESNRILNFMCIPA